MKAYSCISVNNNETKWAPLIFFFLPSKFMIFASSFTLSKLFLEKMPLNLGLYLKQLVISILLKVWRRTNNFYLYILFHLPTPLSPMSFITKKITGCTNEATKSAKKARRNLPFWFFISCFYFFSNSINYYTKSSNDFMILIMILFFYFNIIHIFIQNK